MQLHRYVLTIIFFFFSTIAFAKGEIKLLPQSIVGKTFIFQIIGSYNPESNPNADTSYQMIFSKKHYTYRILANGKSYKGRYHYVRKKVNGVLIGVIALKEKDSGKATAYHMILIGNDRSGFYIYQQRFGAIKPNVRMNLAKYYILSPNK